MNQPGYRQAIADYIRAHALPPDKFSHQPRLYQLAKRLAEGRPFDDDVLYAAAWMHDLGAFVGHRPEDPTGAGGVDHVAYTVKETPALLRQFGFPAKKSPLCLKPSARICPRLGPHPGKARCCATRTSSNSSGPSASCALPAKRAATRGLSGLATRCGFCEKMRSNCPRSFSSIPRAVWPNRDCKC